MSRRRYRARGQVDATAVPAPTEIPADAQAPRQVGPAYYGGDSDIRKEGANWLRALMGQSAAQMEPTGPVPEAVLRAEDTVDVAAADPGYGPVPNHLHYGYLGRPGGKPPSGTYTPPPGSPPTIDPKVAALWEDVVERFPYAPRFVKSVEQHEFSDPGVLGVHDNGRIRLSPDASTDTLLHELTHAAQRQQFPDASRAWRAYEGKPWTPYQDRRGEILARSVVRSAEDDYADDVRSSPAFQRRQAALAYRNPK